MYAIAISIISGAVIYCFTHIVSTVGSIGVTGALQTAGIAIAKIPVPPGWAVSAAVSKSYQPVTAIYKSKMRYGRHNNVCNMNTVAISVTTGDIGYCFANIISAIGSIGMRAYGGGRGGSACAGWTRGRPCRW